VRDALARHEVEMPADVPKWSRVPAGRWSDRAIPVRNAMRYELHQVEYHMKEKNRRTMNIDDGGGIRAIALW